MGLSEWEERELEKIKLASNIDLDTAYFNATDKNERKDIYKRIVEKEGESEKTQIMKEFFNHRYVSKEKNIKNIDYAIRGWVNISFLPESYKSRFSRKKLPDKIEECLVNLGKNIAEDHGELGIELWYKELVNVCKVFVELCKTDKTYGCIIMGIGRIKESKLIKKICFDMINITHTIPAEIGTDKFELLAKASRQAFMECFPKSGNLYDTMTDQADGKKVPMDDVEDGID